MSTQAQLLKQQAMERAAARRSPGALPVPGQEDMGESESVWGALLGAFLGLALALAGLAVGVGVLGLGGETKSYWFLNRASGFVAYLLLWASVVWGLLLSSKIAKRFAHPPALLDAHRFLSGAGLGFSLFHGLILMGDRYLIFPLTAVLVPFASSYEPLLVAAGQIGLWLSALLIATSYLRRWIGQRLWRGLHFSSFFAYWLVLIHAWLLGTDSGLLWVQALYLSTAGSVLFLTVYRLLERRGSRHPIQPNTS